MRIIIPIAAALALACVPALAAPCNSTYGCTVRAEFCAEGGAQKCHFERLLPEQGVGLCTMVMMQTAISWIVGDQAQHKPAHPGFRLASASCVTPDDADL